MSLHSILQEETNPHIINFYRTTILSMSGTTHPCYQVLLVNYINHSCIRISNNV